MMDTTVDVVTVVAPKTATKPASRKAIVNDRKQQVAAMIGRDATAIRTVKLEMDALRKQGLLIDLSISGRSMFTRAATWLELGIMPDEDDPRISQDSSDSPLGFLELGNFGYNHLQESY